MQSYAIYIPCRTQYERGLLNIKGNGRIAAAHLKQSDLLEGGQVDVHSDGSSHYQGHLVQQLGLIWE